MMLAEMANQEHLDVLARGVDAWNEWRANYQKEASNEQKAVNEQKAAFEKSSPKH